MSIKATVQSEGTVQYEMLDVRDSTTALLPTALLYLTIYSTPYDAYDDVVFS